MPDFCARLFPLRFLPFTSKGVRGAPSTASARAQLRRNGSHPS
jgi:hypothetical protein